jgi:hypothetical protein
MKRTFISAVLIGLAVSPLLAGAKGTLTGEYVEARTAEVFTGGCIMNSEAETVGRQAVLAWKVERGSFNGIAIDGLSVVAAVSGDRNLGMQEMGGDKAAVRTAMFVDERANAAQQIALVAMATELSRGLDVSKHVTHDPTCGAMLWFHPLASMDEPAIGVTAQHLFTGSALGTKWSDPNTRSSFFGTFSY